MKKLFLWFGGFFEDQGDRATAQDGSGVYDDQVITISNQTTPPVTGEHFMKINGKLNLLFKK
jgi:hypothetical protein